MNRQFKRSMAIERIVFSCHTCMQEKHAYESTAGYPMDSASIFFHRSVSTFLQVQMNT